MSELLDGLDAGTRFAVGFSIVRTATIGIVASFFSCCDHFGWFRKYKIRPPEKYPPAKLLRHLYQELAVNHFLVAPLFMRFVVYPLLAWSDRIDMDGDLPVFHIAALQLLFFFLVTDATFYWSHRLLHVPFFYKHIHKKHHRFVDTVGWAIEYSHPVEGIVGNLLPVILGPVILRASFPLYLLWLALALWHSTEGHSGYKLPFSPWCNLPGIDGSRHDFHHSNFEGCYGTSLLFWDWVCGTNKPFLEHQAKIANKDK